VPPADDKRERPDWTEARMHKKVSSFIWRISSLAGLRNCGGGCKKEIGGNWGPTSKTNVFSPFFRYTGSSGPRSLLKTQLYLSLSPFLKPPAGIPAPEEFSMHGNASIQWPNADTIRSFFQVNVPKTRKTYCKGRTCRKHTQHKVTQYKAGKV